MSLIDQVVVGAVVWPARLCTGPPSHERLPEVAVQTSSPPASLSPTEHHNQKQSVVDTVALECRISDNRNQHIVSNINQSQGRSFSQISAQSNIAAASRASFLAQIFLDV